MNFTSEDRPSSLTPVEESEEGGGSNLLIGTLPLGSEPTGHNPLDSSLSSKGVLLGSSLSTGGELGVTSAQKRKASEAESNSESEVTREIIHYWVKRANISFEYTKKKANELVKKAKEKMKKSNCHHLECPQCNDRSRVRMSCANTLTARSTS